MSGRHPVFAGLLSALLALGPHRAGAAPAPAGPGAAPAAPDAAPGPGPSLSPDEEMARATAFYEAGQYAPCTVAFAQLFSDASRAAALPPRVREQAHAYRAACLIAEGDTEAADGEFRVAVRENPQMAVPSAVVFPPAVIERFVVVRTSLLEEIRRAEDERARREREEARAARERALADRVRVSRLERLAGEETLIVKNRRWMATVPFGVGQFQNREVALGTVFLATEILLVATAVAATSVELSLNSQACGGSCLTHPEENQLNQNLRTAHQVALVATGGLIAVVAGGIVQAHLAFVPEFRDGVRQRGQGGRGAGRVTVAPTLAVTPLAGGLGLAGSF